MTELKVFYFVPLRFHAAVSSWMIRSLPSFVALQRPALHTNDESLTEPHVAPHLCNNRHMLY